MLDASVGGATAELVSGASVGVERGVAAISSLEVLRRDKVGRQKLSEPPFLVKEFMERIRIRQAKTLCSVPASVSTAELHLGASGVFGIVAAAIDSLEDVRRERVRRQTLQIHLSFLKFFLWQISENTSHSVLPAIVQPTS